MDISGKVVAITGASSGIGRATAKLLAEHGALVVLVRGGAKVGHWSGGDLRLRAA